MTLFKCKHPFDTLYVEKNATEKTIDEDFTTVSYYFFVKNAAKI